MKNKIPFFLISILVVVFMNSCSEPYVKQESFSPQIDKNDTNILIPEPSFEDPQRTGIGCSKNVYQKSFNNLLDAINIPEELLSQYDLSKDMPPVRSQGDQGSCVGWATGYYLKSYHEKIEYGYEYTTFEDVMSPSFLYNQIKVSDCDSGSSIADALRFLKNTGIVSWNDFPYTDTECSNIPTDQLKDKAKKFQIENYFLIKVPETNTDPTYTIINILKTLLTENKPIVISLDIKNIIFNFNKGTYIGHTYQKIEDGCGHAVLIVGYDDEKEAFKFVNSWGTEWGNEGYGWIHYDFFLDDEQIDFQKGVSSLYVTNDKKE